MKMNKEKFKQEVQRLASEFGAQILLTAFYFGTLKLFLIWLGMTGAVIHMSLFFLLICLLGGF